MGYDWVEKGPRRKDQDPPRATIMAMFHHSTESLPLLR